MTPGAIDEAARILCEATRTSARIPPLPPAAAPQSTTDALAIQDALLNRLGEPIGAWKVATAPDGAIVWGAILARDCLASPATLPIALVPPAGVEGEIAFRLTRDLPLRAEPYASDELRAVLVAVPVIEVVASRFQSYRDAPYLDRLADRMSNGALVVGECTNAGTPPDFTTIRVRQSVDGVPSLDRLGGHPRKDPLLPALEFVQAIRQRRPLAAGQLITTGTYTGMVFAEAHRRYDITFDGLGRIAVTLN